MNRRRRKNNLLATFLCCVAFSSAFSFAEQAFFNDQFVQFGTGAKDIGGFSRLKKLGNQTLAQLPNGAQISLFVDGNGNLVDQRGRRVSALDPEIVSEFKTFALLNREKVPGNQRNAFDRFLFASGAVSDGRMTIDLASFSLRSRGSKDGKEASDLLPGTNRIKAGLAALNFFLNTIQNRCLIRVFENQVDYASGTISMDFSSFRDQDGNQCLNGLTLSLMEQSDDKAKCNGGKLRINEMINSMMQPNVYAAAQGFAGLNKDQVANVFGVQTDKLATFGNKLLVGTRAEDGSKESGVVGGPQRVLERQNTFNVPGRFCYRSLDFKDIHEGGPGNDARSVEDSGILFSHEAEEWLCIGANGFLVTFLFNADGTQLEGAPGNIASAGRGRNLEPEVRNGASCLDCHRTGFLAGKPGRYEEQKQKIRTLNQKLDIIGPDGRRLTHGDYFTTNQPYYAQAQQDSKLFISAQVQSGSYLPDVNGDPIPLIPESMAARNSPVTETVMARELGISPSLAKSILGGRPSIPRFDFDSRFCEYKAAAGQIGKAAVEQARKQAAPTPHRRK